MTKTKRNSMAALALLTAMCFTGCAGQSKGSSEQSEYSYAVISPRVDINEWMYAQVDVYYTEVIDDCYSGDVPYVVLKDAETGRTRATSRIRTGLVSEFSGSSPKSADLKYFNVAGETVIAVSIPLGEGQSEPHFYHYSGDDAYGMHECTAENYSMPFESGDLDWDSLRVDDSGITDSLGNHFEFDFSDYPTSVKKSNR